MTNLEKTILDAMVREFEARREQGYWIERSETEGLASVCIDGFFDLEKIAKSVATAVRDAMLRDIEGGSS